MIREIEIDCIVVKQGITTDSIFIRTHFPPNHETEEVSLVMSAEVLPGIGIDYVKQHFHIDPVIL